MSETWIDRVRQWMKTSGTSQGSLARALDCTRGAVGHYLAGRRQPTLSQMERIAGVMHAHPAWLLYGIGPASVADGTSPNQPQPQVSLGLQVIAGNTEHPVNRPDCVMELNALAERCYGVAVEPGNGTPRAYEGEILVVDPEALPHPGDEVLVGFSDGSRLVFELIATQGSRIIFGAMHDRRSLRECDPKELSFMHRIIAVVRRDAFPLHSVKNNG
jgi:transcriptional regulator with XRE-family HTH domain